MKHKTIKFTTIQKDKHLRAMAAKYTLRFSKEKPNNFELLTNQENDLAVCYQLRNGHKLYFKED